MAKYGVQGTEVLADNIKQFTNRFLEEINKDMKKTEEVLKEKVRQRISLSDHTLEDLAEMGHPYASRAPQHIHDPDYGVHIQGGELLAGLYSFTEQASVNFGALNASANVGISDVVEHALYVIMGTSKMVPRDFLTGSLDEVREQTIEILSRSLHNVVVSFQGKKVKL